MRVAIGRLYQETCATSPVKSSEDHFSIFRGTGFLEEFNGVTDEIGGIIEAAEEAQVELYPIMSAEMKSFSGGPVDDDFFRRFVEEFVDRLAAEQIDAVILSLHGAMMTDRTDDPESEFSQRVRATVGETPVIVSLDYHAHVTQELVSSVDGLVAYNTSPHTDIRQTGERALDLCARIFRSSNTTTIGMAKAPMLVSGWTTAHPMKTLFEQREKYESESDVLSVAICPVHHNIDARGMGLAAVAVTEGSPRRAEEIAQSLASEAWSYRHEFQRSAETFVDPEEGFQRVRENRPGLTVLADFGDNVLSGAPGDSPVLLERALSVENEDLRGAVPVVDAHALDELAAGEEGEQAVRIGGSLSPDFSPIEVSGRVHTVVTDPYELRGTYYDGKNIYPGRRVVFQVAGRELWLIISEVPLITTHPSFFEQHGIDISGLDFAVVKNVGHFRPNFEGLAEELVILDTPGLIPSDLAEIPYRKARPVFPLDEIAYSPDVQRDE